MSNLILKAVKREGVENQETPAAFKVRGRTENLQELKEQPLYGQFTRRIEDQGKKKTWTWLNNKGNLERETEVVVIASQDQATLTTYVKAKIDKSHVDPKC